MCVFFPKAFAFSHVQSTFFLGEYCAALNLCFHLITCTPAVRLKGLYSSEKWPRPPNRRVIHFNSKEKQVVPTSVLVMSECSCRVYWSTTSVWLLRSHLGICVHLSTPKTRPVFIYLFLETCKMQISDGTLWDPGVSYSHLLPTKKILFQTRSFRWHRSSPHV